MKSAPRPDADREPLPRRSPGRPPIPRDRIIATALQIVDEEGADALSMRALAQRLDSGTATLYRHFSNRAEVIAHLTDRMFGEAQIEPYSLASMTWEQACSTIAQAMFEVIGRHRNVAPLLVEQVPTGPHALALRERGLAVLLAAGFTPSVAAKAYATLARYVLGFAIQLSTPNPDPADDARISAEFRGLDPALFPATASVAGSLPVALEDEFAFGLQLLVAGLTGALDAGLE